MNAMEHIHAKFAKSLAMPLSLAYSKLKAIAKAVAVMMMKVMGLLLLVENVLRKRSPNLRRKSTKPCNVSLSLFLAFHTED